MLVVIGIIAVLIAASLGGYSAITKSAERAKCQELVSNTATALTALFQQEGAWPKRLALNGATDGKLDAETAYALVAGKTKYMSLTVGDKTKEEGEGKKLAGYDRFGIVTPWAQAVIKRLGASADVGSAVSGSATINDHILHYAIDLDGDGIIEGAKVGGKSVDIRATAAVWCCGRDGVISPYPYGGGGGGSAGKGANKGENGKSSRCDDVWSWAPGQTRNVK